MYEQEAIIKDVYKYLGTDISYLIAEGLLHIDYAKNWLIPREYRRLYNNGEMTYTKVKEILSKRYGISISSIEKMIYNNH